MQIQRAEVRLVEIHQDDHHADPDGPWHKWRATVGLDFCVGAHELALFYRLEDFLNGSDNPRRHILGLGYHYGF